MSDILSFGIERDDLGRKLGGGLAKGSLAVIEGAEGSGKSIFCQRLAYGFLKNNISVTYISTDMSTRDFIKEMRSLDYDIVNNLLKRRLLFVPVFPTTVSFSQCDNLLERLINAPQLFCSEVIVIDSLNMIAKSSAMDKKSLYNFVSFLKKIIGINKSVIITVDTENINPEVRSLLEEVSDCFIVLEARIIQGNLKNIVTIKRWTRSEHDVTKVLSYRVEAGIGLIIDISTISG